MSDFKLSQAFTLSMITPGIQITSDPNSKSVEARQLQLVSGGLYIRFLESTELEKIELLDMLIQQNQPSLDLLQQAQDLLKSELNKLQPPLQTPTQ